MKRSEIHEGMEVAVGKSYPQRAIVMDARPWEGSRMYLGRFGYGSPTNLRPCAGGSGVAVAVCNGRGEWTPQLVQLTQITSTWADEEKRHRLEQVREQARRDQATATRERIADMPDILRAQTVTMPGGGFRIDPTRVSVSLDVLEQFVRGARTLDDLVAAGHVDDETLEQVEEAAAERSLR